MVENIEKKKQKKKDLQRIYWQLKRIGKDLVVICLEILKNDKNCLGNGFKNLRGVLFMNKNCDNSLKVFSTANLFFTFMWITIILTYYQVLIKVNGIIFFLGFFTTALGVLFKYPLIVKVNNEKMCTLDYDSVNMKNIGFFSCLYIGLFEFCTKQSNLVSIFGGAKLKLFKTDRNCTFEYNTNVTKMRYKVFDIILTMTCLAFVLFVKKNLSNYENVINTALWSLVSLYIILLKFRKAILNSIHSINIGSIGKYKLNIIDQYNIFEGIFSKNYGFANMISETIMISKETFCSGDNLRKYILAHEEGHLDHSKRGLTIFMVAISILADFFGIVGVYIVSILFPSKAWISWTSLGLYFVFLIIFNIILKRRTKDGEFAADAFAIKKIGKDSVINALEILKNDKTCLGKNKKLSGIDFDKRIEFAKKFEY